MNCRQWTKKQLNKRSNQLRMLIKQIAKLPEAKAPQVRLKLMCFQFLFFKDYGITSSKAVCKIYGYFQEVSIYISFVGVVLQILIYTRFLKEVLPKKIKLKQYETGELNEKCNVVLLNKLPPKLKDPESFKL